MDTDTTKQLIEAIKTININMDSETGQKAVGIVADKLSQWLIFREILMVVNTTIICLTVIGAIVAGYFLLRKLIEDDIEAKKYNKFVAAINALDLEEKEQRRLFLSVIKEISK